MIIDFYCYAEYFFFKIYNFCGWMRSLLGMRWVDVVICYFQLGVGVELRILKSVPAPPCFRAYKKLNLWILRFVWDQKDAFAKFKKYEEYLKYILVLLIDFLDYIKNPINHFIFLNCNYYAQWQTYCMRTCAKAERVKNSWGLWN